MKFIVFIALDICIANIDAAESNRGLPLRNFHRREGDTGPQSSLELSMKPLQSEEVDTLQTMLPDTMKPKADPLNMIFECINDTLRNLEQCVAQLVHEGMDHILLPPMERIVRVLVDENGLRYLMKGIDVAAPLKAKSVGTCKSVLELKGTIREAIQQEALKISDDGALGAVGEIVKKFSESQHGYKLNQMFSMLGRVKDFERELLVKKFAQKSMEMRQIFCDEFDRLDRELDNLEYSDISHIQLLSKHIAHNKETQTSSGFGNIILAYYKALVDKTGFYHLSNAISFLLMAEGSVVRPYSCSDFFLGMTSNLPPGSDKLEHLRHTLAIAGRLVQTNYRMRSYRASALDYHPTQLSKMYPKLKYDPQLEFELLKLKLDICLGRKDRAPLEAHPKNTKMKLSDSIFTSELDKILAYVNPDAVEEMFNKFFPSWTSEISYEQIKILVALRLRIQIAVQHEDLLARMFKFPDQKSSILPRVDQAIASLLK